MTARFTTLDPIKDGLNWYAYVGNDPVNRIDLWGLEQSDSSNSGLNLNISERLLEHRDGRPLGDLRAVVVHNVGNPKYTLDETIKLWEEKGIQNNNRGSNAHYYIAGDGKTTRIVPENERANHSGALEIDYTSGAKEKFASGNETWPTLPNKYSIGIEMYQIDYSGTVTDATYDSTVELAADILLRNDLNPSTDLIRHYDVTDSIACPLYYIQNQDKWTELKDDVAEVMINIMSSQE